jgi:hypothetical protein
MNPSALAHAGRQRVRLRPEMFCRPRLAVRGDRGRGEGPAVAGLRVEGFTGDHAGVVDVVGGAEVTGMAVRDQGVEIAHDAVLPEERPTAACAAGQADDLTAGVDAQGLAGGVSWECAEVGDAVAFGPAVATRYDKLAVRYEATVHGAAINEWLGCLVHSPAPGPP